MVEFRFEVKNEWDLQRWWRQEGRKYYPYYYIYNQDLGYDRRALKAGPVDGIAEMRRRKG